MKPITLNNINKQKIIKQFTNYINNAKLSDGRISFTADITPNTNTPKPTLYISAHAYLKMLLYIRDTATEIAWHGTVERNQKENWYHIKDVFLYPQIISAATVNTDQEKYQDWLQNIEDDAIFNSIRFQGHSHVNMGVSASGTDLNMYNTFLQVLPKNDFYIFMIMNKFGTMSLVIYDLDKNIIFENKDINVKILTNTTSDLLNDIEMEKKKYLTQHTYVPTGIFSKPPTHTKYFNDFDEQEAYNMTDSIFDELEKKYQKPNIPKIQKKGKYNYESK